MKNIDSSDDDKYGNNEDSDDTNIEHDHDNDGALSNEGVVEYGWDVSHVGDGYLESSSSSPCSRNTLFLSSYGNKNVFKGGPHFRNDLCFFSIVVLSSPLPPLPPRDSCPPSPVPVPHNLPVLDLVLLTKS